jgi:glucokinase
MFVEGRWITGQNAGEIGHISVGFDDPCVCGATGCLEAVASGASILRRFRESGGTGADDAQSVVVFAREGNEHAIAVWADAIEALARALATYVSLLSPELIILGGGVSGAGDELLFPLKSRLDQFLTWQDRPQLVVSTLGERAGTIGASMLAFEATQQKEKRKSQ